MPNNYFIDFLRGHLDGDGSIITYIDYYNTKRNPAYVYKRLNVKFISASKIHMVWLEEKVTKIVGVFGRLHTTKKNRIGNSMYILKFGKKESLRLLEKLYYSEHLSCLSRKKEIYTRFLNE